MASDWWVPLVSGLGGAAIALGSSSLTSWLNRRHQSQVAAEQRSFDAQEARRSEAATRTEILLAQLTELLSSRQGLFEQIWVDAGHIDVAKLEAGIRLLPDAPSRDALKGLRYPLSLGHEDMAYLPKKYEVPWLVERDALLDAIETVASYIRGDSLSPDLAQAQIQRNDACKQAKDDLWNDPEIQKTIYHG